MIHLHRHCYELYMCLLSTAAHSNRKDNALRPFPKYFIDENNTRDFDRLIVCLESMPSVNTLYKNKQELLFKEDNTLQDATDCLSTICKNKDAPHLLKFILDMCHFKSRRVRYISVGQYIHERGLHKTIPPHIIPDHVFEITHQDRPTGEFLKGYHGSSSDNFFSILTNSLQNYSNTEQMKNGSVYGEGVYACEDLRVARNFSSGGSKGWSKSRFLGSEISCLVDCEISKGTGSDVESKVGEENNKYIVVKKSENIKIRYLLLYSQVKDLSVKQKRDRSSMILVGFYVLFILFIFMMRFHTEVKMEARSLYQYVMLMYRKH
ncbi:mono [ADP-ribose] polymerase [Acrasis kona]|uniref:Mono [ADP-ribose] polymerase n=1 Tax=Acrasis kona TaxID=1008807 RepID=A0AAW2YUX1_9EUKA